MSLDIYTPQPRPVTAGGKTINVLPLKVRQIPGFTRAIVPVLAPLGAGDLATAIAVGGEDLVRAVAIATDQPEDWLGELLPDEFLALVTAVVDVNADFFARRVLPALNAATETTLATLGMTPLPSSSPTVTARSEEQHV